MAAISEKNDVEENEMVNGLNKDNTMEDGSNEESGKEVASNEEKGGADEKNALNNAYQAHIMSLHRAADDKASTDLHLQFRRWYSIEVLLHTVQCRGCGDRMSCLSNPLTQCLRDCRYDELLNSLNPSNIFHCK